MELEKKIVLLNGKKKSFYHCLGEGQCTCKRCGTLSWTDWFYKLKPNGKVYCYDCLISKLKYRGVLK